MSEIKYCEDCKHSVVDGLLLKCRHPSIAGAALLVTREVLPITLRWCGAARGDETLCGRSAGRFDRKDPVDGKDEYNAVPEKGWKFWM